MNRESDEEIRLLQRELAFCAGERDVYRALLEQVLKAYDDGSYGENLALALRAVRDALTTPHEDHEIALHRARVRRA